MTRFPIAVTALVLAATGLATVDATTATADSPTSLIAFTSDRDGNDEIYIVDSAGGTPLNLTQNPASDHSPSWSPDGKRIAFISDRSGDPDVWTMNADGSDPINKTDTQLERESDPAWPPQGLRIARSSTIDMSAIPTGQVVFSTGAASIQIGCHRVTTPYRYQGEFPVDPAVVNFTHEAWDGYPAWSPDGQTVAFVRDIAGPTPTAQTSSLYTVPADDGWCIWEDSFQVPTPTLLGQAGWDATGLAWSPSGSTLLWSEASADNLRAVLRTMDIATGVTSDVTVPLGFTHYTDPAYSSDGIALAFSAYSLNQDLADVYVWRQDGSSAPRRLTTDPARDWDPAWRPIVPAMGMVTPYGYWRERQGAADVGFWYGNPGDVPFVGDWDCDGDETPGLYRQKDGYVYLRNSNTQGIADIRFFYGDPDDIPLAGDFDGDGCHTVSIYRPAEQRFYIINELGANEGGLGAADFSFEFGNFGDVPVVGDWDGDGRDEIGLHRSDTGLFYWRNTLTSGVADGQIHFGDPGDRFVAGDWDGDGDDTPAVFRPATEFFYFRNSLTAGVADWMFSDSSDNRIPVTGDFHLSP